MEDFVNFLAVVARLTSNTNHMAAECYEAESEARFVFEFKKADCVYRDTVVINSDELESADFEGALRHCSVIEENLQKLGMG